VGLVDERLDVYIWRASNNDTYRGVYWTKLLTLLKFDKICRNLRESAGIGGNWQELEGISRNQQESAGIRGNQREFAGISRNKQECTDFIILSSYSLSGMKGNVNIEIFSISSCLIWQY